MAEIESKAQVAADVWRQMFGFLMHTRPQRDAVLERLGISPNEARSLFSLRRDCPRTMKELAVAWRCDASTATWHVNRLELLGFARRGNDPDDRRVRLVTLTKEGEDARETLLAGMFATPPELLSLSTAQLASLQEILESLPIGLDEFPHDE